MFFRSSSFTQQEVRTAKKVLAWTQKTQKVENKLVFSHFTKDAIAKRLPLSQ